MSKPSLTELANHFGSDKGTTGAPGRHNYTYFYEPLFSPIRNNAISILEVGLCVGGPEGGFSKDRKVTAAPSLAMWLNYFPHATIYGFDISDFSVFRHPRVTFIRGDAGIKEDLQKVSEAVSKLDIVIDDGSHASYHQQLTFVNLFSLVKPGGLYIIEDLHWQPENYERSLPKVPLTRDLFRMLQAKRSIPKDYCFVDDLDAQLPLIASVELFSATRNQDLTWHYSENGLRDKLLIIRKRAQ